MNKRASYTILKLALATIALQMIFLGGAQLVVAADGQLGSLGENIIDDDPTSELWFPPRSDAKPAEPQIKTPPAVAPSVRSKSKRANKKTVPTAAAGADGHTGPALAAPPASANTAANQATSSAASSTGIDRTYTPSKDDLTKQLAPSVQRGFELAQRGALYAARQEFLQVLRRTAEAKDAQSGGTQHSSALAAGLRALDESEDFVPRGPAVEAELDMRIASSSHRTHVLGDHPERVPPRDAIALYHRYAQEQLGNAVAGEQAGSMALYGLGKIAARWVESNNGDAYFTQTEITMYGAAFAACSNNHLAANELGVCLCKRGHPGEAARLFEQAIKISPSSTAYHNLAVSQQKLGMTAQGAANEQESERLAVTERAAGAVSREAGIAWLSPAEMSGVAQSTEFPNASIAAKTAEKPQASAVAVGAEAPQSSRWQKVIRMAKSLPLPGTSKKETATPPSTTESDPSRLPAVQDQSQWR
jgi:tetratricopeptide (TPR) repeat protein